MEQFNFSLLLNNINLITFLIAVATYVLTSIVKKLLPTSFKNFVPLLPFIIGLTLYLIFGYLRLEFDFRLLFKKGIQAGGIATLIYALIKQLFKNSSNIKSSVKNLLSTIVSADSIKNVVELIFKEYHQNTDKDYIADAIFNIIIQNSKLSENECSTITQIVLKAMDSLSKKK